MLISETFIFIHIPKTAGTSISRAVSPYATNRKLHKSRDCEFASHITLKKLQTREKIQIDNYFTFAFVRNPWERIQSLYYYVLQKNQTKKRDWHDKIPRYTDMGFNKWVNKEMNPWIYNHTRWHNKRRPLQQVDWILPCIDFVGRYETLQEDFNTVCETDKISQMLII